MHEVINYTAIALEHFELPMFFFYFLKTINIYKIRVDLQYFLSNYLSLSKLPRLRTVCTPSTVQ